MRKTFYKTILTPLFLISVSGCVGKIVGAAVDTTIAVAKVPFKVAGAAVDVVAGSSDDDNDHDHSDGEDHGHTHDDK